MHPKNPLLPLFLLAALVSTLILPGGCASRSGPADGSLHEAEPVVAREDFQAVLTEEDGVMSVTFANRSGQTITHGNAASGALQIQKDGRWYDVPMLPDWSSTDEGYTLGPGETWTSPLTWDAYGDLEDGSYRLVWRLYQEGEKKTEITCTEARFSLKGGQVISP